MDKTYKKLAIENFKLSDDMCRGYKDYLLDELEKLEKIEQIYNKWYSNSKIPSFDCMEQIKEVLESEG